jgi:hypothetical protein
MPELAYIDPGSGSLIIQAVIATLVAVPLLLRHQLGRLLAVVRGRGATGSQSSPVDDRTQDG